MNSFFANSDAPRTLWFALSEFVVAWGIAYYYAKRANAVFDPMAAELVRDAEKLLGGGK